MNYFTSIKWLKLHSHLIMIVGIFLIFLAVVIFYVTARNTSAIEMQVYSCGERVVVSDRYGRVGVLSRQLLGLSDRLYFSSNGTELLLGDIFQSLGGELSATFGSLPVVGGQLRVSSGEMCGEDVAEVQVFVLRSENGVIRQAKLDRPDTFDVRLSNTTSPDCVVVEYGPRVATTNRLCEFMADLVVDGTHTLEIAE